jgi:hypothetical protein
VKSGLYNGTPNNGLHPTTDTLPVMYIKGLGRRVMPGVRRLR